MASPYRSSYYKDAYEAASSATSKRFHSSSGASSHYYDSEDRKRHRLDSSSSQTSARYSSSNDYHHRSSSSSSTYLGKPSSSSYYDGSSHRSLPSSKPSISSSMPPPLLRTSRDGELSGSSGYPHRNSASVSRYMESTSSRRYDDYRPSSTVSSSSKYPSPRRAPPPPAVSGGGSYSRSKSSSNGSSAPTPLMKLSVEGSGKEYFGSRYRQAPPEHHRESNYGSSYSSSAARDRRLSASAGSSRKLPSLRSSPTPRKSHAISSKSLAIRKATQVAALSVSSRIRKRAVNSSRILRDKIRKREPVPQNIEPPKRREATIRSKPAEKKKAISDKDAAQKSRRKDKDDKQPGKDAHESEHVTSNSHIDEQKMESKDKRVESFDSDKKVSESQVESPSRKDGTKVDKRDSSSEKGTKAAVDALKTENSETDKAKQSSRSRESRSSSYRRDSDKIEEKLGVSPRAKKSTDDSKEEPHIQKALLKLQCHYCNVRCITFREFTAHARSYEHSKAIHKAILEMRNRLNAMRSKQRDQQRKLEKSSSDKTLSDTTSYCRVCELNFRTDPTEHEANDLHNEIKSLIYQKCDVCDIDFRVWKVYLHHLAALEHAKRCALLELQKREGRGELVEGTNLSEKELGLHLVEEKQVLYCNVCARYIPIRETVTESKIQHCVTFGHVKNVDDHYAAQEREQRQKKREAERAKEEALKAAEPIVEASTSKDLHSMEVTNAVKNETVAVAKTEELPVDSQELPAAGATVKVEILTNEVDREEPEGGRPCGDSEDLKNEEDDDEDEIELHADTDDDADEEEPENSGTWIRRTRSSARKASTSSKSNVDGV